MRKINIPEQSVTRHALSNLLADLMLVVWRTTDAQGRREIENSLSSNGFRFWIDEEAV